MGIKLWKKQISFRHISVVLVTTAYYSRTIHTHSIFHIWRSTTFCVQVTILVNCWNISLGRSRMTMLKCFYTILWLFTFYSEATWWIFGSVVPLFHIFMIFLISLATWQNVLRKPPLILSHCQHSFRSWVPGSTCEICSFRSVSIMYGPRVLLKEFLTGKSSLQVWHYQFTAIYLVYS